MQRLMLSSQESSHSKELQPRVLEPPSRLPDLSLFELTKGPQEDDLYCVPFQNISIKSFSYFISP